MATGFSTHVPRPTNPGDGPKRDTLICTFCRQKRIKCHGEHYDHLNGGKCDPCKTHHLPCSPREAAPGLSKDAGTRKRKRLPELPHQVTPQPSTSTASVRSHAPARPIQPRIVSQEDKCADVQCDLHQLAKLVCESLFDAWKCRLAQAFDPGRPKNALEGREILGRLKDNLDINCKNRLSWLGDHARELEEELAELRRRSPLEHERILPLLELAGWLASTPLDHSVPSQLSIGTYHAQQVLNCFRRYARDQSDLAPLFFLELLRVGGQKFVLDDEKRIHEAYGAFGCLAQIFTKLYDKRLKKLAPPLRDQESCFSALLLCEQLGFQELTDRFSALYDDYNPLQRDPIGQTALHMRCSTSNGQIPPSLLRYHSKALNQSDSFNMTPIQLAVYAKNPQAVHTLLQEFDKSSPDTALLQCYRTDWGVLLLACYCGCWQNVELLLRKAYGDVTDYDPIGNPQPLDDQMAKSLRVTLEGDGSTPDKLHIINMLANYGVRHHESISLTRIARTLRLDPHIQQALVDLERQWEADAFIPRSSTKTARSQLTQTGQSWSYVSNRRTALAPILDNRATTSGPTGFRSFQGGQEYGFSASFEQLDHEANVLEEDASELGDSRDEQSEESSQASTEEFFRDESINIDVEFLPPLRPHNMPPQLHQQAVSPFQTIQDLNTAYSETFDATTHFDTSIYPSELYGEPQVGQNNAALQPHSPTQYHQIGYPHWSSNHAPEMYLLHSMGRPQMSPMLQTSSLHAYNAQARAPWHPNSDSGGMSPAL